MIASNKFDFLIIGAGIVGLAVAKELTEKYPSATIAILEKEDSIGMHASGRNSGIMHSGIYYPRDSLKAAVCAEGAQRMMHFAEEHGINYHKTGKLIICSSEEQLSSIDLLLKNAADNKIAAHKVDEKQIKEIEPYAATLYPGIFTPSTASIDSKTVLKKLSDIIISRGVKLFLGEKLVSVNNQNNTISSKQKTYHFGFLFNCAGAETDRIAKQFGLAKDYTLLPFKGIYYKLSEEKNHYVKGNIYPVPDLKLPFLGVHFTRTMDGSVYVGPTAIPAFGRENYGLLQGISWESFRIIKDLALLSIANHQNFRLLMQSELKKYYKPCFLDAASKLMPSITFNDLQLSKKVGIRPQLINVQKKKLEMDYIIEQNKTSMHILNAISPAFTSAFCFAELIVKRLSLQENKFSKASEVV